MEQTSSGISTAQAVGLRGWIRGGLCAITGLLLLCGGMRQLWLIHASAGWPTVQGQITRSAVITIPTSGGAAHKRALSYSYTVGGTTYTNDDLSPTDPEGGLTQAQAEAITAAWPQGHWIDVHYNPSAPGQSFLVAGGGGKPNDPYVFIVIGVALLAFSNSSWAASGWITGLVNRREHYPEKPRS